MQKRLFFLFVLFVSLVSFCGVSCAAEDSEIVFEGTLTVNDVSVSGKKSIRMPKPFRIETQDDDPGVLAMLLKDEGHTSKKASINVNTSNKFTVSGKRVKGVFAIRNDKLESIGGNKPPYGVPAKIGDCYIGIKNSPKEEREEKKLDAGILLYVKMTVK